MKLFFIIITCFLRVDDQRWSIVVKHYLATLRHTNVVETWGYEKSSLFEPLERVDVGEARNKAAIKRRKDRWNKYKMRVRLVAANLQTMSAETEPPFQATSLMT